MRWCVFAGSTDDLPAARFSLRGRPPSKESRSFLRVFSRSVDFFSLCFLRFSARSRDSGGDATVVAGDATAGEGDV